MLLRDDVDVAVVVAVVVGKSSVDVVTSFCANDGCTCSNKEREEAGIGMAVMVIYRRFSLQRMIVIVRNITSWLNNAEAFAFTIPGYTL